MYVYEFMLVINLMRTMQENVGDHPRTKAAIRIRIPRRPAVCARLKQRNSCNRLL